MIQKVSDEQLALRGLVGAAQVDPADAVALLDALRLSPGDFDQAPHQALFVALASALREGRPLELLAIAAACPRVPREQVLDALTQYELGVGASRLKTIKTASRRRQLVATLGGLQALARDAGIALDSAIGEVHRVLGGLTPETETTRSSESDVLEHTHRVEAVQAGRRVPVLQTGVEAIDFAIGGLQPTLSVVGALPGVGKSALAATILSNVAKRGIKIGLLSLEDERGWVANRLISQESDVPVFVLGNRPLGPHQLERYSDATGKVYETLKNVVIDDTHGMTPDQAVASARQMVAMGCRAVLIDHLGELRLEREDRHDLEITSALQALRGISKQYGVPVVVFCHLRRRDSLDVDSVPKMSDFAFSAGIERMARVALGLFRVGEDGVNKLGMAVLKQTNGPAGMSVLLNLNERSGTVAQTAVSPALREKFKWGEE